MADEADEADEDEIGFALARAASTQRDLVALADAEGRYVYVNPAGLAATGYAAEEILGTPVLDTIHPEDVSTIVAGLSLLGDPVEGLAVNPAYVRMRRADGSWLRVESNATVTAAPDGAVRLALVARLTSDPDLHEELIGLLTSGAPSHDAFALVPEFGRWRQPDLLYAVVHRDDHGRPAVVGSERLVALAGPEGLDDARAPWSTCAADGADLLVAVDELEPAFAARAGAAGITHLRCRPVPDPLHGDAAVVVLGQDAAAHGGRDENLLARMDYLLRRMAIATELVLAWRQQVVELRRSALTDPLTGLANRGGFWAGFDGRDPGHHGLALLYVDLDHFKAVNDAHGHPVGDALLVAVADRLRSVVRPGDLVARMGGDEFTVVLRDPHGGEAAIAERIVAHLSEPVTIDGREVRVGASVGVATTPPTAVTPHDLLDAADRALYRAKAAGRGCWRAEPLTPAAADGRTGEGGR